MPRSNSDELHLRGLSLSGGADLGDLAGACACRRNGDDGQAVLADEHVPALNPAHRVPLAFHSKSHLLAL